MIICQISTGETLVLPNPDLGDGERILHGLQIKRSMDGTVRTHKRAHSDKTIRWSLNLTREKARELKYFVQMHGGKRWKLIGLGYNNYAYVKTNPFQITMEGRGVIADSKEYVLADIEFELVS